MKNVLLFLVISAACLTACTDHDDEPEIVAPTIGYMKIDSILGYNRHVALDIDSDGRPDLYFTSVLIMENGESYLYLQARPGSSTGTRILTTQNPQPLDNALWTLPLAKGAVIGNQAPALSDWSTSGQNSVLLRVTENG
jgi:hypothetical protein